MRFAVSAMAAVSGVVLLGLSFYGQPAVYLRQARDQWDALMDHPDADQADVDADSGLAPAARQDVAGVGSPLIPAPGSQAPAAMPGSPSGPVAPVVPTPPSAAPADSAIPGVAASVLPSSPSVIASLSAAPSAPEPVAPAPAPPAPVASAPPPPATFAPPPPQPETPQPAPPAASVIASPGLVPTARPAPERQDANVDVRPVKPEPARPEPARSEHASLEAPRSERGGQETPRSEPRKSESPKAEPSRSERGSQDTTRSEPHKAEVPKVEPPRPPPQKVATDRPIPPPPPPLPQAGPALSQQAAPAPVPQPVPRQEADDTQSVLARLRQSAFAQPVNAPSIPEPKPRPSPAPSPTTSRLSGARAALANGQIEDARRLLQEAQLQLVFGPIDTASGDQQTAGRGAVDVANALDALSANDVPLSRRYIDVAMGDLTGKAVNPPIQESTRRASGYAPAYPPR